MKKMEVIKGRKLMKIKLGILTIILSLTLVGCSNLNQEIDESDTNKQQTNISNENDTPKNDDSKEDQKQEEKTIDFKIYTIDADDTEKILEFETVKLKESSTIEDKLNELCTTLQKDYFKSEDAQIKLESIDKDNIATINLVNEEAWSPYFQGSTGGLISEGTIIETLLQKEYKGEWIKGLRVVIDGEEKQVFDHAPFMGVYNR